MINYDKIGKYKQNFAQPKRKLKILLYRSSINSVEVYDALKFSHHLEVYIFECDGMHIDHIMELENRILSERIDIVIFTKKIDTEKFSSNENIRKRMLFNQSGFDLTIDYEKFKLINLKKLPNIKEVALDFFTDYTGETIWNSARLLDSNMDQTVLFHLPSELLLMISEIKSLPLPRGYFSITLLIDRLGNISSLTQTTNLHHSLKLYRSYGINIPLMLVQDYLGRKLKVINNEGFLKNRMISNCWVEIEILNVIDSIYVDLDGTLISDNNVNIDVLSIIYFSNNIGLKVYLITRHIMNPLNTLKKFKIDPSIFKEIIHITNDDLKSAFISDLSILIDNEFPERYEAYINKNILSVDVDFVSLFIRGIIILNRKRIIFL
jgi:hypothetical protein